MAIHYAVYDTPIGDVTILSQGKYLTGLMFGAVDPIGAVNEETVPLYDAIMSINQFFHCERLGYNIPLNFLNATEFEKKVYEYVMTIPYAETRTYQDVAEAIGEPNAEKQVMNVLGKNPLPLFVPCHRVVAKTGNLGVYVGGIELKRKIINFEKAVFSKDSMEPNPTISRD
ncbi:MAG: methylated-DNA--[protein]-cysteine S-methyltransferase [Bacilli bacterium]|nr:methylated-DNA--[protein]-cysteine S-methyltransferase [Bacilli bacterium]